MTTPAGNNDPIARWASGERDIWLRRLRQTVRVRTGRLRQSLRRRGRFGIAAQVDYAGYVRTDRAGRPFPEDALARTLRTGSLARLRRILAQTPDAELARLLSERRQAVARLRYFTPRGRRTARQLATRRRLRLG